MSLSSATPRRSGLISRRLTWGVATFNGDL
jgi:hypothetical protein